MAIVGESGSGKSTLLQLLSAQTRAERRPRAATACATASRAISPTLGEAERRFLFRTDWGYVHQDATLGPAHGRCPPAPMSASG